MSDTLSASNPPFRPTRGSRSAAADSRVALTPPVLAALVAAADGIIVTAASYLAYLIWLQDDPYASWSQCALVTVLGTVLALNCFGVLGLYRVEMLSRPTMTMLRMIGACAMVVGILIALSYATKTSAEYSRGWAGIWFAITVIGLIVNRAVLAAMAASGRFERTLSKRIAVVGEREHVDRMLRHIGIGDNRWIDTVATFAADRPEDVDLAGLERCIRHDGIDTVVVAIPWVAEDWALQTLDAVYQFPVDVLLCPRGIGLSLIRPRVRYVGDIPMLTMADRPLLGWRYIVKEVEDRLLASIILLMIAPVLLAIAAAIKATSKGPVLFKQKRYGFNNQLIEVWKFRSMYHELSDANASQLTRRGDPRVTPIGRFLRSSSLDELPQFFNVLRGDMSIVGPRPHATAAKAGGLLYQEAVRQYAARHRVKPGITGWAQVNGWRGETETVEQIRRRVHHDIAYIEDWSVWLDLKIIAMTVLTGFTGKNAY